MYSTLTKDDFGVYLIFVYFYQEFVCCQSSWLFLVFCNCTRVWISSVFKYIFVEFYWIMGWRLVLSLYTLHCSLYPLNRVTFCSFSSTLIVIYKLWSWVFCLFFIHNFDWTSHTTNALIYGFLASSLIIKRQYDGILPYEYLVVLLYITIRCKRLFKLKTDYHWDHRKSVLHYISSSG